MSGPIVLNKRGLPGGRLGPGMVYIGRPSRWGNPFKLGRDGDRDAVMAKYEAWLEVKLDDPAFRVALLKLAGAEALVCWCKPDPCHGDILVRALENLKLTGS